MANSMKKSSNSSATLRIWGDHLIPDEISKLLICEPTQAQTKGQIFSSKSTGSQRAAKTGLWRLSAIDSESTNLESQILEIFQQLPSDLEIWKKLTTHFDLDLVCGLFLTKSNEVISLASGPMHILSTRGVALKLDIYNKIE